MKLQWNEFIYVMSMCFISNWSPINFTVIKIVGPPLSKFNRDEYVKSGRRHAEETACRTKEEAEEENCEYSSLCYIL
jgi:hypothetical protein